MVILHSYYNVASNMKTLLHFRYIAFLVISIILGLKIAIAQTSGDAVMELAKTGKTVASLHDIPGNLADLLRRVNCEVREPADEDHRIKIHALSERVALAIVPCDGIFLGSRIFIYMAKYRLFTPVHLVVPARTSGFQSIDWGHIHSWDDAARQLSAIFLTDLCGAEITWRAVYTVTRPGNPDAINFPLTRIDERKGCRDDSPWESIWTAPQWPQGLRAP